MKLTVRVVLALLTLAGTAGAQAAGKKVLTQDTYDAWRVIQGSTLSPDGRWAAYTLTPVVGDGHVVARMAEGTTEHRAPRGFTGRPITSVNAGDSAFTAPPAQFTADSRFLVYLAYAPKEEFDRARRERRRPADLPKNSLGIMDLASGQVVTLPRVRSFRLARESGKYLVYLREADEPPRDSAAAQVRAGGDTSRVAGRRRDFGTTLVIRDLTTGTESQVHEVSNYVVDDSARWVAYAVTSRTAPLDGVYLRELATGKTQTVLAGLGNYRQLAFDRAGVQLAFVSDREEFTAAKPRYALYHATTAAPSAQRVVAAGVVDSLSPVDRGRLEFTREGNAIIFGVAPIAPDTIPADSLADKAVFDLWHWKDPRLQPQQRLEANRDRERSYASIYHLKSKKVVRLANDTTPTVTISDDGRTAVAVTTVPYALEAMWGGAGSDVHVIDATTGARTLVATKNDFGASLSPGGKYVLWFDGKGWKSYAVASKKLIELTTSLKVPFHIEDWDSPDTPPAYGVGGWLEDDRGVLVYDRYDVWELDPAGARAPRMITDSAGTRGRMQFRIIDLDPDDRWIDAKQPLVLRAFDTQTKASGYYRDRLDATAAPERMVFGDEAFGQVQKARRAERYLVTRSTVSEFANLWTGPSIASLQKISDANPQQRDYLWPSVELVSWLNADGKPLKGLLYKPEGFDASKQYPLIVYYYERLSDGLHQYHSPTGRNVINPSVYTSLGYLVFFPDVIYEIGWPGPSAVKSIIPGVQSLIQRGFVNPKALGIAGQSWGGYQTAYLITQSTMFAAAVPNAPVANMTSAYGGIRWGSGLARAFQYEKTQSRIGGSIWEQPVRFVENSPLFHLDRVTTPVFFMHNDADDAVPWYQGIELFVGLRRLGKEVYFITYNGDVHNPRKRANQKDVDRRMQEFFATKLKGAPAPDWMVRGIPYIEKGRDQIAPKVTTSSSSSPASTSGAEGTRKP
jgi:dipeptidyl aminopeptidase/acylaminoacyl peptidase